MTEKIIKKTEVFQYGRYSVIEGEVIFDERGTQTMCWVECEGVRVSSFSDVDAAHIHAKRLHDAGVDSQPAPEEREGEIEIVEEKGDYSILCAKFKGKKLYWATRGGNVVSDCGDLESVREYVRQQQAKKARP